MRRRRAVLVLMVCVGVASLLSVAIVEALQESASIYHPPTQGSLVRKGVLEEALQSLEIKTHAPKTGYSRDHFGGGWAEVNGCTTRDVILYRDLTDIRLEGGCTIVAGVLNDPYTGKRIEYSKSNPSAVQIDHVVPLSDAWQKGAQDLTPQARRQFANDPLELLAVDGPANQAKGDSDAAAWLPSNKRFRCEYIERQIKVKRTYGLWVSVPEKQAMQKVIGSC